MNATLNGSTSTTPANVQALDLDTTPAPRGFSLPCLWCNEEGTIRLDLADVTGETAFTCTACDAEFSLADVQAKLAAWKPVIAWCALAPALPTD